MIQLIVIFALIASTLAVIAFVVAPQLVQKRVIFGAAPDLPKSFGCDMAWLAIKSDDPSAVAEVLELTALVPANWDAGIGTIYDAKLGDMYVFVTPPVKGWIFVAGVPLPLPVGRSFVDKLTPLLARLSSTFRDVQYFAVYPDIDLFAWARLERGRMVRAFAIGDDGVIWDRGRLTAEEKALGLKLFELRGIRGRKGDAGGAIILHPTDEQVLQLARSWSIDTGRLDKLDIAPAHGFIAHAPSQWRSERVRKAA